MRTITSKERIRKILLWTFIVIVILIFLGSCAEKTQMPEVSDPPGFFYGLLHGFIILFSFIGTFFGDYAIYAFPNSGGWYDFGFFLGVMMFFGGGGAGARRK